MNVFKKIAISSMVLLTLSSNQLPVLCEESANSDMHLMHTNTEETPLSAEEMLTDLRDVRLCLAQLKQQAVNIFQEATRVTLHINDMPQETTPTAIAAGMLKPNAPYLPPRKEWLVFYVNTLEPTIHLLCEDISDIDSNNSKCSKEIAEKIKPLWKTWRKDIEKINKRIDQIQEHIGSDNGASIAIANDAIAIYSTAEELERVRYKAAIIFRQEYKKLSVKAPSAKTKSGSKIKKP